MKTRLFQRPLAALACTLALLPLTACSGTPDNGATNSEPELETLNETITVMAKPGGLGTFASEAGRDVRQVGDFTLYGADLDDPTNAGLAVGSVQLFKNGLPVRSYSVKTPVQGVKLGTSVALSTNWLAASISNYPLGERRAAILIAGRDAQGNFASCGTAPAGENPSCVTCTTEDCTPKPGVEILTPTGFYELGGYARIVLDAQGNEIVAAAGNQLVHLVHSASGWQETDHYLGPVADQATSIAISGNRLAVASNSVNAPVVDIFERTGSTGAWLKKRRLFAPSATTTGWGRSLDFSGDTLVVASSTEVHFYQLGTAPLTLTSGIVKHCSAVQPGSTGPSVAISGDKVVVANGTNAVTYKRTQGNWQFYGGLPYGIGQSPNENSSLWGAAIDGDKGAIGWRNYGEGNKRGAAVGFSFDAQSCGTQITAGATQRRVLPVVIKTASGPSNAGFPPAHAIDGNTSTSYGYAKTPGTKLTLDLGEQQVADLVEINWGTGYAKNYTLEVSSDGTTWFQAKQVTGGLGGTEWVDLHNVSSAMGSKLRLTMNTFSTTGTLVGIRELRVHGRVSEACAAPPQVQCDASVAPHACAGNCGGMNHAAACFCDDSCVEFGDCCSPNGQARGPAYYAEIDALCNLPPSDPTRLQCGGSECTAGDRCCDVVGDGNGPFCFDPTTQPNACPALFAFQTPCDGPADCPTGASCIATYSDKGGIGRCEQGTIAQFVTQPWTTAFCGNAYIQTTNCPTGYHCSEPTQQLGLRTCMAN